MSRYIDAEKTYNFYMIDEMTDEYYIKSMTIDEALSHCDEVIPTADVVEVVRCKDCIHNEHNAEDPNALCELYYGMTDQYGFCSYGDRRDNE